MMSIILSKTILAAALLLQPQVAFASSVGASGCAPGRAAVEGFHLTAISTVSGELLDYDLEVTLDGTPLSTTTPTNFTSGKSHTLELTGASFRGFLFRLDSGDNDVDTSEALTEFTSLAKIAESVCVEAYGVAGITHTSNNLKSATQAFLQLDELDTNLPLDVTVVIQNNGLNSQYYYNRYLLNSVEGPPTAQPSNMPSDTSASPTGSPIDAPTTTTDAPVVPPTDVGGAPTEPPMMGTPTTPTDAPVAPPTDVGGTPTEPPMMGTPTTTTDAPVVPPTDSVATPTESPMDPPTTPTAPVAPPVDVGVAPTDPPMMGTPTTTTDAPVAPPTEPPMMSTPTTPTDAPVAPPVDVGGAPTDPPMMGTPTTTTDAPVAPPTDSIATPTEPPMDPPTTPTDAPVDPPTEPPVDATPETTPEPTPAPIESPTTAPSPTSTAPEKLLWSSCAFLLGLSVVLSL